MKRTLKREEITSGHLLHVSSIDRSELPANFEYAENYSKFYVVRNFDETGHVFMYLATGDGGSKQVVGWYPKGAFWPSYGKNIVEAINGMQRDGWLHA